MADLWTMDVVKAMRYATLKVKMERVNEMRFRVWCAVRLLRLTSWLLNCNIEFDDQGEDAN